MEELRSFPLLTYANQVLRFALGQTGDETRRLTSALRDILFAGNNEWRSMPNALRAHGRYHLPFEDGEERALFVDAPPEQAAE